MKKELEKVNTKLMTPQDFLVFLNKYTESAVSLQGALNVGINSALELREIIPDADDYYNLENFIKMRDASRNSDNLQFIVRQLSMATPTYQEYTKIFDLPAMTAKNEINRLLALTPNRKVLQKAVYDGDISKVQKIVSSYSENKLMDLMDARSPFIEALINPLDTRGLDEDEIAVVDKFQKTMTGKNKEYFDSLNAEEQKIISSKIKKQNLNLSRDEQQVYDAFLKYNEDELDLLRQLASEEDDIIIAKVLTSNGYTKRNPRTGLVKQNPRKVIIGAGATRSRGRPPKITTRTKMKVGQGIKAEQIPTNVEFGKYVINTRQLKKQILNLKNKSGGSLTWFQSTPISDSFTEMLNEMVSGKGLNKHILKTLDKEEQNMFYEITDRAGLMPQFQLTKPKNTEEDDI